MTDINKRSVYIATPAYGNSCNLAYTVGLLDAVKVLNLHGYSVNFLGIGNDSLITRARNKLVDNFLQTDGYYFVFIDADIGFCGNDVLRLIQTKKDLVCGLYPKKCVDWGRVNFAAKHNCQNLENFAGSYVVNILTPNEIIHESNPVVEIEHGGTGFMLITRDVFEHLSPHVKEYRISTYLDANGQMPKKVKEFFALSIVGENDYLLSEDYFFCALWKQFGGKVYADLNIKLSHHGNYEFKGDIFVGGVNSFNNN